VVQGLAFAYLGDVFLLPRMWPREVELTYERVEPEPLTIWVGYRGHTQEWPTVLSPSALRGYEEKRYMAYKKKELYATDLLREAYFRFRNLCLTDLQARGILQHHKTIGPTDVLDLTSDIETAKWFALHEYDASQRYQAKSWHGDADFSSVYQVIVRVLGETREPLPILFHGRPLTLLPFNVCPLELVGERPRRQRGFGVSHLGSKDSDALGMILNVTEWRYHPELEPHGWDVIGGPECRFPGPEDCPADPVAEIENEYMLPPEPEWLSDLLGEVRQRADLGYGATPEF